MQRASFTWLSSRNVLPAFVLACAVLTAALAPARARADEANAGKIALGFGAHLAFTLDSICQRDSDVVSCTNAAFYGGDLSAHYYMLDWLALGARGALSFGNDAKSQETLTRVSAELRIVPPLLFSGMWLGAELGAAVLDEEHGSRSASQSAFLLGAALGWDLLRLTDWLLLGIDARVQLMTFGDDPPALDQTAQLYAHSYAGAAWLQLGARLTILF